LLFDAVDRRFRQFAAYRADDALAILRGRLHRIDFERCQIGDFWNRRDSMTDDRSENLSDVGRGVGADQQYLLTGIGQVHRRSTGQRGLTDAAFAGEE